MLNQKETGLLQDLKKGEQLCIDKYTKYEGQATSTELKTLLNGICKQEQTHLETVCQIINGATLSTSGGGGGQKPVPAVSNYASDTTGFENDKYLCSDALASEKHVSSMYNTSIFEFKDTAIRDALNHIQKEEQGHGELIYKYMELNAMYG